MLGATGAAEAIVCVKVMTEGTHQEVMDYIAQKAWYICPHALAILYFRNNAEEFDAYMKERRAGFPKSKC